MDDQEREVQGALGLLRDYKVGIEIRHDDDSTWQYHHSYHRATSKEEAKKIAIKIYLSKFTHPRPADESVRVYYCTELSF